MRPIGAKRQRHHPPHRLKRQGAVEMRKQAGAGTAARCFPFQALTKRRRGYLHHQQIRDAGAVLGGAGAQLRRSRKMQKAITPIIRTAMIGASGFSGVPIFKAHQGIDEVFHGASLTEFWRLQQSGHCLARLILRFREIA